MDEIFNSGALNLTYFIVLLISAVVSTIMFVGGEVGAILDFDFDLDLDADGSFDFIQISPFTLGMFGATFGLTGLVTRFVFEMDSFPSLLWAMGLGIIIGGGTQALFFFVLSASYSGHFSLEEDAVGREAEVIITIPEIGLGQIAYNNKNGRQNLGARSVTSQSIDTGNLVTIEKIVGRVAFVRPVDILKESI